MCLEHKGTSAYPLKFGEKLGFMPCLRRDLIAATSVQLVEDHSCHLSVPSVCLHHLADQTTSAPVILMFQTLTFALDLLGWRAVQLSLDHSGKWARRGGGPQRSRWEVVKKCHQPELMMFFWLAHQSCIYYYFFYFCGLLPRGQITPLSLGIFVTHPLMHSCCCLP